MLTHAINTYSGVPLCRLWPIVSTSLSLSSLPLLGRKLNAYSITNKKKKVLSENCAGHFSTTPSDTSLFLYELAMHLQDIFPCQAKVFLREDHSPDSILADMATGVVTMKALVTESSVIASSALDEDVTSTEVAEMPVGLDIEVEAVALDDNEIDHLRQDTRCVWGVGCSVCVVGMCTDSETNCCCLSLLVLIMEILLACNAMHLISLLHIKHNIAYMYVCHFFPPLIYNGHV